MSDDSVAYSRPAGHPVLRRNAEASPGLCHEYEYMGWLLIHDPETRSEAMDQVTTNDFWPGGESFPGWVFQLIGTYREKLPMELLVSVMRERNSGRLIEWGVRSLAYELALMMESAGFSTATPYASLRKIIDLRIARDRLAVSKLAVERAENELRRRLGGGILDRENTINLGFLE